MQVLELGKIPGQRDNKHATGAEDRIVLLIKYMELALWLSFYCHNPMYFPCILLPVFLLVSFQDYLKSLPILGLILNILRPNNP
jgi:hypothetical protein